MQYFHRIPPLPRSASDCQHHAGIAAVSPAMMIVPKCASLTANSTGEPATRSSHAANRPDAWNSLPKTEELP
jgi:hypothetical protein